MKRLSLLCAAGAVVLFGAGSAIGQVPPPNGSYRDSCSNISFDGHTLIATCLTFVGTPVSTSLAFADRCTGDIANINGTLICR
jgi:hypothetical protein